MSTRPIFYDTETTGIQVTKDFIVEIAAFDPVNNTTFEELVNPGYPIPEDASRIHHITDDMVKDKPNFATVGEAFLEFCKGDVILIAHNNDSFDQPLLENECKRHNLEMADLNFLDSLKWARRYRPDLPKHTLQYLRQIYDIEENNAHRALDDVIILHKVFKGMTGDLTIEQVAKLLNKPREVTHMPFGKHQGKLLKEVPKHYFTWLEGSGAFSKPQNKDLYSSLQKQGILTAQ